jgi:hypothetical protein
VYTFSSITNDWFLTQAHVIAEASARVGRLRPLGLLDHFG